MEENRSEIVFSAHRWAFATILLHSTTVKALNSKLLYILCAGAPSSAVSGGTAWWCSAWPLKTACLRSVLATLRTCCVTVGQCFICAPQSSCVWNWADTTSWALDGLKALILQLFILVQMVLKTKLVCVWLWLKIKSKLKIWIVIYFAAEIFICSQNANATADPAEVITEYIIYLYYILKFWIHKHIWLQSIWIGLYILIYVKCRERLLNVVDNISILHAFRLRSLNTI